MNGVFKSLAQLPRRRVIFLAILLVVTVAVADHVTGYDLDVSALYVLSISWASWAVGRGLGFLLAGFSTISCGVDTLMAARVFDHPVVPFWNTFMMLVVFCLTVYWTAGLKTEIAERVRAEKAKLQTERVLERQEKLAVLGTLTAGIAHEIRNPLTSLKARLYTLEKHVQSSPPAKKDTEIISGEICRLERIVQEALSFARPADPKLQSVGVNLLLREVQGLMSTSVDGRGVQLVVEPGSELFVRADSGHLKQVLINLVRNAADAIKGSGVVTLRARSINAVLGGRETTAVAIEVCDTGAGIPPEVEKRLFDPFFSTKEAGTGLGLPIAARIVERHGGTLQYQTRPGQGTTFSVVLPGGNGNNGNGAKSDLHHLT